ncbi:hypothetical protein HPO96_37145 [Kribbella sandramycini]|uniref:Uncharacterized protein n=1 Tax=Kribbella sandramycini TaxID=60450 RepID=A0A7Y4P2Y4_9ACTN|nr:hypothetical protein [Kribbella sandramycini]MBB6564429.1 hypothetical protein [Kribbella sandramycini]NOL45887.1 hypothetical protein [Kribbella sandramycini]
MSTPGNGDFARVVSPTSGREWLGEVLVWGPHRAPLLRDAETAEVRWFPASWVKSTIAGPPDFDRGECICPPLSAHTPNDGPEPLDRACPHHGDPEVVASNILKAARSKP